MIIITLATPPDAALRLYTLPGLVDPAHLPASLAARIVEAPAGHLLAWSAAESGIAGFSQDGRSLVLPLPLLGAGIGSMQRAKGSGFVTLFVKTADAGMIEVLGSQTFQQAALDRLLAQQAALGALLGCTLTAEDWGYDC